MGQVSSLWDRYWSKVELGPVAVHCPSLGPCWIWIAGLSSDGYGSFDYGQAHRLSYRWWKGPIPLWLELDHLCRRRACVRPGHLEAVTHTENTRRGQGHGSETHCPTGHPYSGANLYVRPDGSGRGCKACRRDTDARRYPRRMAA